MSAVIETADLTKYYGPVRGVEGVNLQVSRGELFGFLGPNGAGKTTTIRMLLDLLRPSRGFARVLGVDAHTDGFSVRSRIGYAPAEVELYPEMTGGTLLDTFAEMRPTRPPVSRDAVLAMLDLKGRDLVRRVSAYSTGMKRKIVLAIALQHDPELLILDEPTWGLDPHRRRALLEYLNELTGRGRTVFFSSHNLSEVEAICDRVGIVNRGRLVAQESIEGLRQRRLRRVVVTLESGSPPPRFEADGLEVESSEGDRWVIRVLGAFDPLIRALAACRVHDLIAEPPRLEDFFFDYYREDREAES